jgi:hypothetical protein
MRVRNINFKIFQNHELDDLELETGKPLFKSLVGLWCCADREGRFEWDARKLRCNIFPYRSDREINFNEILEIFVELDIVRKYEIDGKSYGWLVTFVRYQCISDKEAPSLHPEQPWCTPGVHPEATKGTPPNSDNRRSTSDVRRSTDDSDVNTPEASNNGNGGQHQDFNGTKEQSNHQQSEHLIDSMIDLTVDHYPMKANNTNVRKKWKMALETEIINLHRAIEGKTHDVVSRYDISAQLHDRVVKYAAAKPEKLYTLENWLKNGVYQQKWIAEGMGAITPAEIEAASECDTFKVEDVDDSDGLS